MTGPQRLDKIRTHIKEAREKLTKAKDLVPSNDSYGQKKLGKLINDTEDARRKIGGTSTEKGL